MPRRNENADYHRPKNRFNDRSIIFNETSSPTGPKITAEAIVREHRKHWETIDHVDFKEPESLGPIRDLIKAPKNRSLTLERICWILVIACLVYLSIFVFAPFLSKVFF